MKQQELRQKIMHIFYEKYSTKEQKVDWSIFRDYFPESKISDSDLNNALYYLQDSGYIKIIDADDTGYIFGWILKEGIDFTEKEMEEEKPFWVRNVDHLKSLWQKNNHRFLWFILLGIWTLLALFAGKFLDNFEF